MPKACILALTAHILTEARYSDNLQFSFMTKKEMQGTERVPGMKLNLEKDTIVPDVHLILSKLLPQCYDRTGFLLGPIILALKIFLSRVCEIIDYSHHETTIAKVDEELGNMILKFLSQLKISQIKPFPRAWVKMDFNLGGFVIAQY